MPGLDFDFNHTLGWLAQAWIERHCPVPGGIFEGQKLTLTDDQLEVTLNHYRIKPRSKADYTKLAAPFHYRRSIMVAPQKTGKSPFVAALGLFEGLGPSQFAGWAKKGDFYACYQGGCGCGWKYWYEPGEAKGQLRNKSLIGLLAYEESQTRNVFEPMQTMVLNGPLKDIKGVAVREGYLALPNRGRIVPLTSKSQGKLGQPYTAAFADESGLYTRGNRILDTWQTIRRAVAAMQGRTFESTNAPDPMENSAAQIALESKTGDIYRFYKPPPPDLDYSKPEERAKIHQINYAGTAWIDPKTIDKEAAELCETDPAQAERFYGNRMVQGKGHYLTESLWDAYTDTEREVADGEAICLGFDGSRSGDWTAIRAETSDGYRFTPTYGPDSRPTIWNPEEWGERIPRGEVTAAVKDLAKRYRIVRFYYDPRHWETQGEAWASDLGHDRVVDWPTNQITRMFDALVRFKEDLREGLTSHSDDHSARLHALAARKVAKPGDKYVLGKPSEHQKIDIVMADILAHEAAADARATGGFADGPTYFWLDDEDPDDGYDYY
jgi:hypothetical protein